MSFLQSLQEKKTSLTVTKTIVTDKYLNQYEEVYENGEFVRKYIGKRPSMSKAEEDYYLDKKMSQVMEGLYISSADPVKFLELLKQNGITHIINLATSVPCYFPDDIIYLKKDILDLPDAQLLPILPDCISFIETAFEKKGKVLVHCNMGVSRSASVVIAFLMSHLKCGFAEAFSKVKHARSQIDPNYGFQQQLKIFEKELQEKESVQNHQQ